MPYWGGGPTDNDYAASLLGASVLGVKQRMFESTSRAIDKDFPELALVAHLRVLRAVAREFPRVLHVSFGVEDLEKAEELFHEWYSKVEKRIPSKYRARVHREAEAEFRACRALFGLKAKPWPAPKRSRVRRDPPSTPAQRQRNGTATIVETGPGAFSLLLNSGTTAVDATARALGFEPSGYFWERVALFLTRTEAPSLKGRFEYDCESSMFCAHGADELALRKLGKLLNAVVLSAARLRKLVMSAKRRRFSLDDD